MAQRGGAKFAYSKPLAALRRSITFENFDTKQFMPKLADDPFFDGIAAAKRDLISALESGYVRAFP